MGNSIFRSGSLLLSVNRDNAKLSESTASKIETIFQILRANPKVSIQRLEALLSQIPKVIKNFLLYKYTCIKTIFSRI
jgi:hypothetical protein